MKKTQFKRIGRISIVVGTRPEAIKMAPVVLSLRERFGDHVDLVSTGQHQELLWQRA